MKLSRQTLAFAPAINLHKIICCVLFSLSLFSCKKEEVINVIPATKQDPIKLVIEKTINDSTIVLKWTKFTGKNFQGYRLERSGSYFKNGIFGTYDEIIDASTNVDHLSFTEDKMPFTKYINYAIVILHGDTSLSNNGFWPSDGFTYDRPNSLVYGQIKDVLYDNEKDRIFAIEDNRVNLVSASDNRVLASAAFPVGIGYCSMGDFNGSTEYYVPTNDGWLNILDGTTLLLKDRIFVAGTYIGSVVAAWGILYVGSSDMQIGYSNCIKIFDRATKNLLGRTGNWDATRLYPLEGSEVELVDLTTHNTPVDLSYFHFSPEGTLLETRNDSFHGDHPMDAGIVRSFPDGSKLITASSGSIFDKSLAFDRYVDYNGQYSDFAFNSDGSIIYAAKPAGMRIEAIEYPTLNKGKNYPTTYVPFKIFRNGNTLISVEMSGPYQQNAYMLVEKIEL